MERNEKSHWERDSFAPDTAATLADLPYSLPGRHGRRADGRVEAASRSLRNNQPHIGAIMNRIGHSGGFAPEKENVVGQEGELRVRHRRLGGEQYQPPALPAAPGVERREIDMAGERGNLKIIHAGALEIAVGHVEAGGLDDVDPQSQARGHAQYRACIAGDIRLVERNAQQSIQDALLLLRCALATPSRDGLDQRQFRVEFFVGPEYTAAPFNANQRRGQWIISQPSPCAPGVGELPLG